MKFNVINLEHRKDRWKHIAESFPSFALKRFNALTHPKGGWVGCLKSHGALLSQLISQDKDNVGMYVVLEDDCELLSSPEAFEARWEKYRKYLSEHMGEWDFFSGGGVYVKPTRIVSYDPFIIECDWSVCTQFVVHTKQSAKTMIDFAAQTEWNTGCDNNLAMKHRKKIWLPYPMFCRQLETGKSDIASDEQKEKIKVAFKESAKVLDDFVAAEKAKAAPQLPIVSTAPIMQNIDLSTVLSRHIIWTEGKLEAFKECAMYVNAMGVSMSTPPPVKPQVALTVKVPNMSLFTNFLSEQDCKELIDEASKSLNKSKVVGVGGKAMLHEARTNSGTFLGRGSSPLIERIEQHISMLTGIPIENGEALQISRYEVGEEYKPHYDYFNPKREDFDEKIKSNGQRVATFLMYLSTPEDGGQTTFPDAKIEVPAVMGNALLFRYPKADRDELTLHGGTPVKAGVKWIAVKWLRDRAFGSPAKK
jgi:prolyl 4-hydroxylase